MGVFATTVSIGNIEGGDRAEMEVTHAYPLSSELSLRAKRGNLAEGRIARQPTGLPRRFAPRNDKLGTCEMEAMVDTGASDSMFPASLLQRLHLFPRSQVDYVLADGSEVTYGRGQAHISIGDRDGICPVIFGPDDTDSCLIGAATLQILMLSVDSTNETLLPTARGRLGYGGNL